MAKATCIFIIMSFLASGCVTVKLGEQGNQRAEDVQYAEPQPPFIREKRADVDRAWLNSKTGNLISYLSDCKDPSDPSLDQIVSGMLSGIGDLQIERKETPMILGREGRRVQAVGKVDGVSSQMDLLVFKRNQCIYILSYVGVREAFARDQAEFNRFVAGFRAP